MAAVSSTPMDLSLSNDLRIHYHLWKPEGEIRAGVLVLHGFGEHAGRYQELGAALARAGLLAVAPDLRGHGKTSGKRGHIMRFDEYLEDVEALLAHLKKQPGMPSSWILLGHSMGGLLAIRQAMRPGLEWKGLVVSNPLLALGFKVPLVKRILGKAVSRLVPALSMANELNPDHLSRDQKVGQAYVADPLVHRLATARWFTEMLGAMADANARGVNELRMPVLFLLSTSDHIVDMRAAKTLFERMNGTKELRFVEGAYHELFNELEKEQTYQQLVEWIMKRLGGSGS